MGKEWESADKVWDFGKGQTKAWVKGEEFFYKVPGSQTSSIHLKTISDIIYKTGITGVLEVFGAGTRVAKIRVPSNKKKVADDLITCVRTGNFKPKQSESQGAVVPKEKKKMPLSKKILIGGACIVVLAIIGAFNDKTKIEDDKKEVKKTDEDKKEVGENCFFRESSLLIYI